MSRRKKDLWQLPASPPAVPQQSSETPPAQRTHGSSEATGHLSGAAGHTCGQLCSQQPRYSHWRAVWSHWTGRTGSGREAGGPPQPLCSHPAASGPALRRTGPSTRPSSSRQTSGSPARPTLNIPRVAHPTREGSWTGHSPGVLNPWWTVLCIPRDAHPTPWTQPDDAQPIVDGSLHPTDAHPTPWMQLEGAQPMLDGSAHPRDAAGRCLANPTCRSLSAQTHLGPLSPCQGGTVATHSPPRPYMLSATSSVGSQRWTPGLSQGHTTSLLSKNSGTNFYCQSHVYIFKVFLFFFFKPLSSSSEL